MTDLQTPGTDLRELLAPRRNVVRATGIVAGVGALAACSTPATPTATPESGTSTEAATSGGTATSSETSSSAVAGGTPTSEIPVGGGKIYPDTLTVVTQPVAGTFKAFDTTCPHQGCAVGSIANKQISCPCHGSVFDATSGDRVSGPAKRGLTVKTITVSGDSFTVA